MIRQKLFEIEAGENVKILHAVESGSRAWGFASPDSDYDVRFIYVRPKDFYLMLQKTSDVIEWQLDEIFDINGWDLRKTLCLLHKSNPTLFEWCSSPIIYHTTEYFDGLKKVVNDYFSTKTGLWHYLKMAEGNYHDYLKGENVKLKKYFYVIRPILACKWILHRQSPPPMLFSELLAAEAGDEITPLINDLLKIKMASQEVGESKRIIKLNEYINRNIAEIMDAIGTLPKEHHKPWDELNRLFLNAF